MAENYLTESDALGLSVAIQVVTELENSLIRESWPVEEDDLAGIQTRVAELLWRPVNRRSQGLVQAEVWAWPKPVIIEPAHQCQSCLQRLVRIGGRLVKHARYYWLLLAENHLTRRLFGSMVGRIAALPLLTG